MIGSLPFIMFYDKNGRNFSALTFTVDTVVAKGLGSRTEKCQWVGPKVSPLSNFVDMFVLRSKTPNIQD